MPRKVAGWILEDVLDRGAMGVVYRARNGVTGEVFAVKTIAAELIAEPNARERFKREIALLRKLSHPNIVRCESPFEGEDGAIYVPMELLQGEHLKARLDRAGPLPITDAVSVLRQAASALSVLHAEGIVHRDVKLEN